MNLAEINCLNETIELFSSNVDKERWTNEEKSHYRLSKEILTRQATARMEEYKEESKSHTD